MNNRQKAFLYLANHLPDKGSESVRSVIDFLKTKQGVEFARKFESLDYLSLKHILGDHFMRWKQGMKGKYTEFG